MNSVADVWDNVLQQLKKDLSETTISTWFDELEAVDIQGNTFILHCPNSFKKGYIESLFLKNIKAALHDLFSTEFEVRVLDSDSLAEFGGMVGKQSDRFTSDEFTFDTFVVGPSNKLAYAASMSVAEHPAKNYNPLLIYGDSGLGKTHLIYAIANKLRKNIPGVKIAYVKGDELTNELVDAIREGKAGEMREKYRQANLLLVDDVQFIAGKKQTQEEFFHTFNTLYESGKQIVLTSDRPPSEMTLLDDRLRTRFEWGLLVDVAPPDFETRMAIVKNKAALLGMDTSAPEFQYSAFYGYYLSDDRYTVSCTSDRLIILTAMPEDYTLDPYASYDELYRSAQYLLKEYRDVIGVENPYIEIANGDYTIYGEQSWTTVAIYDQVKDPIGVLLNHAFHKVRLGDWGDGQMGISFDRYDLSQVIGEYPIISVKKAQALLEKGYYVSSTIDPFPGTDTIKKVELTYHTAPWFSTFVPYYKFYVEEPESAYLDDDLPGIKSFATYYVPAVDSRYIADLKLWDGSING